jgi:drug/metabolite transporter (DMT)-like permease
MASISRLRDWGLLLVCNLIWGTQFVFVKVVQREMGPLFATLFPLGLTVLILLPLVEKQERGNRPDEKLPKIHGRDFIDFLLLGALGQAVTMIFGTWGIRLTLASDAALFNLALPITTAVMAYFLLGERMTIIRAISFVLAIVGVLECSGVNFHGLGFSGRDILIGNLFCIISVLGSAFYNTFSKTLLERYSVLRVVLYTDAIAFLVLLPFTIYLEPQSFKNFLHFTLFAWTCLLFLALLRNLLALVLFLHVLKRLDATVVGLSTYLIPFFGVLTAGMFLGEKFTAYMLVGGFLVLCSTLLTTISDGRQRRKAALLVDGAASEKA